MPLYETNLVCRGPRESENDQGTRGTQLVGEHCQSGIAQVRDKANGSCNGGNMEMSDEPGQRETFRGHKWHTRTSKTVGL